jgi:hypothetical protein
MITPQTWLEHSQSSQPASAAGLGAQRCTVLVAKVDGGWVFPLPLRCW